VGVAFAKQGTVTSLPTSKRYSKTVVFAVMSFFLAHDYQRLQ
jgi:hypothetical protein